MKNLLLLLSACLHLQLAGQTLLCKLDFTQSDTVYRTDLIKEDAANPGNYFIPKAVRTKYDSTLKWIIYKIDPVKDIPVTDTFILINDYIVISATEIAVVGQKKDTASVVYRTDANQFSYSVYKYSKDTVFSEKTYLLQATFRNYRFDQAGYLSILNDGNKCRYIDPNGNILEIDGALVTVNTILSSIYPNAIGLFSIIKDVTAKSAFSLLRYDAVQNKFVSVNQDLKKVDSIAHLATGMYLVKKGDEYSIYNPEKDKFSAALKYFQKIGNDSVLMVNEKKQVFFIDNNLQAIQLCQNSADTIRSAGYYSGAKPAILMRFATDSLGLYDFSNCGAADLKKIKFEGAAFLLPLAKFAHSLYYLSQGEKDSLVVLKVTISAGALGPPPVIVGRFFSGMHKPAIAVYPIEGSGQHAFLIVLKGTEGLRDAKVISFPGGSGPVINNVLDENASELQFIPGKRFLSFTVDGLSWNTIDLLNHYMVVNPVAADMGKVTLIESFYQAPCKTVAELFYFKYMVGTKLKFMSYKIPLTEAPVAQTTKAHHKKNQHGK